MTTSALLTLFVVEPLRALGKNPVRSGLTTLGIAVGVTALVWVVAVGRAGSARAEAQLHDLGDNLVWIEAGSRNVAGVRTGTRGTTSLTVDDMEAIRREIPAIARVAPQVDDRVQVLFGGRNWSTTYRGVSPDFLDVKRWRIARGAAFTDEDTRQAASVCLLGRTVAERLFADADPVGQTLRVRDKLFLVVGVLAPKGQSATGQDQDDAILMPYTAAQHRLRGRGYAWLDDILCSARSPGEVAPAIDAVVGLLRQRHRIGPGDEDDFNIRRPDELIKAQIDASHTLALLLATVASIALLVGGIGIMNVMLASVAQRTREIGLRMAVGAPGWAVQAQFLGEGVLLSALGGLAGVAASYLGAGVMGDALGWTLEVAPDSLLVALGSSSAVGLVFGFLPARRASRLDPIEALRAE